MLDQEVYGFGTKQFNQGIKNAEFDADFQIVKLIFKNAPKKSYRPKVVKIEKLEIPF